MAKWVCVVMGDFGSSLDCLDFLREIGSKLRIRMREEILEVGEKREMCEESGRGPSLGNIT